MMLLDHYIYLLISQTTGYINNFEKNKVTMALMVEDKQISKIPKKYGKRLKN